MGLGAGSEEGKDEKSTDCIIDGTFQRA
jgi:hypothetical protein